MSKKGIILTQDSRYGTREQKSRKIIAIIQDCIDQDLSELSCLDVGCSTGGITNNLAPYFHEMIGVDIDHDLVTQARQSSKVNQEYFSIASAHNLPFGDQNFDVAICAQVYEHVSDQSALAEEIWRILKPGGICFFSGPNRLKIMEEHYWLPFLSWLPRPIANLYLRVFKRGAFYDAYPLFYWQIRNLWNGFEIFDYMPEILRDPERFELNDDLRSGNWIRNLPTWIIDALAPLYPNYNWILKKSL